MHATGPDGRATGAAARPPIHGECLCGEIAFEFRESHQHGRGRAMGICHCSECQRWSGSSSVPFVVASPQNLRVTKGQELMAHHRGEGTSIRTFCRRCGSSLYTDDGTTYYVSAGVLRDLTLTPAFHVHIAERPAWDNS